MRSLRVAFVIFSVLCVLGVLASLARGTVAQGEPASPQTREGT